MHPIICKEKTPNLSRGYMFNEILDEAMDVLAANKAAYGDARIVESMSEGIAVSGKKPEEIRRMESAGFGVRALFDGGWGFASCKNMDISSVRATVLKAVSIARSSAKVKSPKERFIPSEKIQDEYIAPCKINPFSVPLEDKLSLLYKATEAMLKIKGIKIAQGFLESFHTKKYFASTQGSRIKQDIIECGGGLTAYAIKDGHVQQRSYPTSFHGNFASAGWEYVQGLDIADHATETAEEAAALLKAKECPCMDDATIILAPDQLALQIHESIGHPIELDRILGQEASFAGTSFLRPEMLGCFLYGSPFVTVIADATTPNGLGTFGYDDEGTPAMRFPIIEEGVLQHFLSSCWTAPMLQGSPRSNGAARADGWSCIPLIRMTNINLEPGDWDYQDLISDTKHGFLFQTNKSWSIDDKRINFQFGTEVAREIKNGKLGNLYKNPVYTGITPQFWRSCDAVCDANYWELIGILDCGKGEPVQTMHVGHGASPARFRNVKIGSSSRIG